ncbi:hypothetical protein [uncultured Faecalibaculum sp.]|uniref:hypothetical protein n=1 Tax=uncultured Faecalibaculum sp. TaxID=1729681 RepID=UPI0027121937|nr:hypothetical protein [uncultured Faecalibaculum sp.]
MNFNHRDVEKALRKKGFKEYPSDHNSFVLLDPNGKKTLIRTKTSHNKQDIDSCLVDKMRKQLHLSKSDFADLIRCPLSKEVYFTMMKEGGFV